MFESNVPNFVVRRGKTKDVYDIGEEMMVMVATDRIAVNDHVFVNEIPGKGEIITQLNIFWSNRLDVYYHLISVNPKSMPEAFRTAEFKDRIMLVERAKVIPYEFKVYGYLCGDAWQEYSHKGTVSGETLPTGLKQNMKLPMPVCATPKGLEESKLGQEVFFDIINKSIEIYQEAADHCWELGVILAETKFEWGIHVGSDELILVGDIMTPDNSQYWFIKDYALGDMPLSFNQMMINYLNQYGTPVELPIGLAGDIAAYYKQLFDLITS